MKQYLVQYTHYEWFLQCCFWYLCLYPLFFSRASHFPQEFETFFSLHSTIWGPLKARIGLTISSGSVTILFFIQCISNCLRKAKVGIIFLPFWKCPYASAVFTSTTYRYHAKSRSGQNLVAHVLSSEIGDCCLFLWSSTWLC